MRSWEEVLAIEGLCGKGGGGGGGGGLGVREN